jgi:dimethylhistidine N-methyltransferase
MTTGASAVDRDLPQSARAGQATLAQALRGLSARPKRLPPSCFYDARGSALFERICEQPEYYLTRTETMILRGAAAELARLMGSDVLLVELGSGASVKTRLLLDRLEDPTGYVPVDISSSALFDAARDVRRCYPWLDVTPVCADFTRAFALPASVGATQRIGVFFPGSTIGNFDVLEAVRLMRAMRVVAGHGGALVIGVDLVKDVARLEAAYNDAAGVTAEFNLNVLRRLNRELRADFDLEAFQHEAVWVPALSRIEMRLVSTRRQQVAVSGRTIEFGPGERLITEHCHKYTVDGFRSLARAAGWTPRHVWTDDAGDFSVHFLVSPAH